MPKRQTTEQAFLAQYDRDRYAKPAVMVDVVIFTVRDERLKVLLVKRGEHPFRGQWALPGGAVHVDPDSAAGFDRTLEAAALRELYEETGVKSPYLEQLKTYGSAERDPRDWTVSVAYFALISSDRIELRHGTDAAEARWFTVQKLGVKHRLAFDHKTILADAITRLRAKVEYTAVAVHLLPEEFTLTELQHMYELLLQATLDKSAFRRRVKEANMLEPVKGKRREGQFRPAQLYRFARRADMDLFFPRSLVRYAK